MNVYDFDKTIYDGDSTADFYLFALGRHKSILTLAPSLFGRFLRRCDSERDVADFWETHINKIKPFYLAQQREDDVIISASPEFLLQPACDELGIGCLIASRVDPHTGRYDGVNCHGEEKVRRFREVFGQSSIDKFYSDSYSDTPLALIAQRAYIVKGNELSDWKK